MIRTFADKDTERLYATGQAPRMPPDMVRRALRALHQLHIIDYH